MCEKSGVNIRQREREKDRVNVSVEMLWKTAVRLLCPDLESPETEADEAPHLVSSSFRGKVF